MGALFGATLFCLGKKKLQFTRGVAGGVGVARSLLGLVAPLYRCLLTYKSYLRLLCLNTHTTANRKTTNMRTVTLATAPKLMPISLVPAPESPSVRASDCGGVLGGGVLSVSPDDDDGLLFVEEEDLDWRGDVPEVGWEEEEVEVEEVVGADSAETSDTAAERRGRRGRREGGGGGRGGEGEVGGEGEGLLKEVLGKHTCVCPNQ